MTNNRHRLIRRFLTDIGWGDARLEPLAGDASNRRYLRVQGERAAVLMDAPRESGEDTAPFVQVTQLLRGRGFSAPEIIASDPENGFLLLEDLGDDLFARAVAQQDEVTLYAAAVDMLVELQASPAPASLPRYDAATCCREARLLTQWYIPGAGGTGDEAELDALIHAACAPWLDANVVVLRDFHAENLIWLPQRQGTARVGLLDYQDALAGHPAYDLVSLLEDARRDTSPALRSAMVARFVQATGADPDTFAAAYATYGAQRNIKILGIFARLSMRDGKPGYLNLMPRVWSHLQRDLRHPALADLHAWVDANVPPPDAGLHIRIGAAR